MFPFDHPARSSNSPERPSKRSRMKRKMRAFHLRRHRSHDDSTSGPSYHSYPYADPEHSIDEDSQNDFFRGEHVINRSASSPHLSAYNQSGIYTHSMYSSTHSLRFDPRYYPSADDGFLPPMIKPLSPIAEQDYFSPERQSLPLPPEDASVSQISSPTGSQYSGVIRPSSVYSTFITRPLNRSISQTSSRTHASTSSAAPPSIPPIDFRPTFPTQISVRMPKPAIVRAMSPIEGSSEGHGGTHDDGSSLRAESFKTAESLDPESSQGAEQHDIGMETGVPPAEARISQSSSSTSWFERRWRRSEAYGSGFAISTFPKLYRPQCGFDTTPAFWLFWAGFIAPWCWMIGGWYYTIRGQRRPKYAKKGAKKELILPMWVMEKRGLDGIQLTEKEAVSHGVWFGYPFVAPSMDKDSVHTRSPPTIRTKRPRLLDPWIFRCRVAAFTSGVLIVIGFIIAFIVVAHKYS